MIHKEKAFEIVQRNEQLITDRLFQDGYMFDDELDEYMTSPVARKLASCIEEFFKLEDGQYVIRIEMNTLERSDGVLIFSESSMSVNEVQEIAKGHYKIL